tara:strand:+ start:84 stop:1013 length:930 start_codon:yes stop_codon:yes gene_type:complete
MKKKIFYTLIIIFIGLILLKLLDNYFYKVYGLGKPLLYQYSKVTGYNIKPSQKLRRLGNEIVINDSGMRSNSKWTTSGKNLKILFFGDSVTYGGSIVSNNDLFSEITCRNIELINPQIKSLCGNYGVNGYGIEQIYRKIKFKKIKDEDFLIITMIENDLERGFNNLASQPFWSKEIKNFYPAITEIIFIYLEKFKNNIKFTFNKNKNDENINQYYGFILENFYETLMVNKKQYLIVYSPSVSEIENKKNNLFKDFLRENFINFIDLSENKYSINKKMFNDEIHLNKLGHKTYADIISKEVVKIIGKEFN